MLEGSTDNLWVIATIRSSSVNSPRFCSPILHWLSQFINGTELMNSYDKVAKRSPLNDGSFAMS
eukprot:1023817-Prorocentrum_lima.AAC.1